MARAPTWVAQSLRPASPALHQLAVSPWPRQTRPSIRGFGTTFPSPGAMVRKVVQAATTREQQAPVEEEAPDTFLSDAKGGRRFAGSVSRDPSPAKDADEPANTWFLSVGIVAVAAILLSAGFFFRNDIKSIVDLFTVKVADLGPLGYVLYALVYTVLEVIAVPAAPLTLTAGYLFGTPAATAVVSLSATSAAVVAFLISRYLLREKVLEWAAGNKTFAALDKALKRDAFKCVLLLRLSPLLPFAASNYLYGLTSIDLGPYALASWLGMLPGTFAYVSAGSVGRTLTEAGAGGVGALQLGAGAAVTLGAIAFIGKVASDALREIQEEGDAGESETQ